MVVNAILDKEASSSDSSPNKRHLLDDVPIPPRIGKKT